MIDFLLSKYGPYDGMPPHIKATFDRYLAEERKDWEESERKRADHGHACDARLILGADE